jgi:hypothetical protein
MRKHRNCASKKLQVGNLSLFLSFSRLTGDPAVRTISRKNFAVFFDQARELQILIQGEIEV